MLALLSMAGALASRTGPFGGLVFMKIGVLTWGDISAFDVPHVLAVVAFNGLMISCNGSLATWTFRRIITLSPAGPGFGETSPEEEIIVN